MRILDGQPPMHWALAGVSLGIIAIVLLWTTGARLGISSTYESICRLASDLPYFRRADLAGKGAWRLWFALGLLAGGALSAVASGGWRPTWAMGPFDDAIGWGPVGKALWMFGGGILVGLGTRIADGCTSGHGLFGLANLEWASLRSVLAFMASGIATTWLIYGVLFR